MAVDTPVLERRTSELTRANNVPFAVPTRSEYEAEEEHNARIRDNYARLINPNNRIEDVFNQSSASVQEPVQTAQPVQQEPYLVQNARADAAIFRADNPINRRFVSDAVVVDEACEEEESEDLRPTAATRQYRTVDIAEEEAETTYSEHLAMTKKQKTAIIVAIAVVVSLIVLIIINATVIANLNSDIAMLNSDIAGINAEIQASVANITEKISKAQSGLDTLRGATAGANLSTSISDVLSGIAI
ncbi:MAG: hypothetical protein ACI4MQ_04980 [Candidatus Coproplasma sp.]